MINEALVRKLASEALYEYWIADTFTLMRVCEYVVEDAVRDMPEVTRPQRHQLYLDVWQMASDPEIEKSVEKKVAEYEASQETETEAVVIDYHPDNNPEENSATLSDGTRIEVARNGITVYAPERPTGLLMMRDIIKEICDFCEKHPNMENGPAHIVLSDFNIHDSHIQFCLKETEKMINAPDTVLDEEYCFIEADELPQFRDQLQKTKAFLNKLLEIPEHIRLA